MHGIWLSWNDTKSCLESQSAMLRQVRQELRQHTAGVTGVPHFVINGRYHLSGAQETSTFVEVLSQL